MSPHALSKSIFKQGSTTYFYSSLFFPSEINEKVSDLYAFVRVADNYVDQIPQDKKGFKDFRKEYEQARNGGGTDNQIIINFRSLEQSLSFDPSWTDAFLDSMESDLSKHTFTNFSEVEKYIYGSAEVIGLYLTKILSLEPESYHYAQYLGKAMQYINFIRDVGEDIDLGRIYIPLSELTKHDISQSMFTKELLTTSCANSFKSLIHEQIEIYYQWQKEAEKGFKYIPRRYLIPIKTASEMYKYTAWRIYKNPQVVFEKKVKPSKKRIFGRAILESITP
jgi:phytoene synthase